jgi:hypothetical protein
VTNDIPLDCSLILPGDTSNSVQTLKAGGYQLVIPAALVVHAMSTVDPVMLPLLVKESVGSGVGGTEPANFYLFLHFTFQEYFVAKHLVWWAFFDRNLHSMVPLVPTHACLKRLHACAQ